MSEVEPLPDLDQIMNGQTLLDGKEPCPECGKRYVPGPGMGVHRHSAHRHSGAKVKARRGRAAGPGNRTVARPLKIDLTVDEIFDAVVSQMFPRGSIPVTALAPLLRWRHATDILLREVAGD